jgi:hypothetical protein
MIEILLTQDKFAIIDDENYELISKYKWSASKMGNQYYAVTKSSRKLGNRKNLFMHRLILGLNFGDKRYGDHINHDTLDNRNNNLRIVDSHQSSLNRRSHNNSSSIYKGVGWDKHIQKWRSRIYINNHDIYLGTFHNDADAAKAYDAKAKELFGEFANLNFPTKGV